MPILTSPENPVPTFCSIFSRYAYWLRGTMGNPDPRERSMPLSPMRIWAGSEDWGVGIMAASGGPWPHPGYRCLSWVAGHVSRVGTSTARGRPGVKNESNGLFLTIIHGSATRRTGEE